MEELKYPNGVWSTYIKDPAGGYNMLIRISSIDGIGPCVNEYKEFHGDLGVAATVIVSGTNFRFWFPERVVYQTLVELWTFHIQNDQRI